MNRAASSRRASISLGGVELAGEALHDAFATAVEQCPASANWSDDGRPLAPVDGNPANKG